MTDREIEAIAQRVADLLTGYSHGPKLVTVAEVAEWLGVSRDYVYEHAEDLGGFRLGDGPKAPLRFDRDRVSEWITVRCEGRPKRESPAPRRHRTGPVELLPIRGRA